jgi:hypothetical protein
VSFASAGRWANVHVIITDKPPAFADALAAKGVKIVRAGNQKH